MSKAMHSAFVLSLAAAVGACGAPERTDGPAAGPQNTEDAREMQTGDTFEQEVQEFRTSVEAAIRESEQAIERAEPRIRDEARQEWQEFSSHARSTWEEIRTDVQGLIAEDNGRELERSREEAAAGLAELHGDLIEHQLRSAQDAREFQQAAGQHLRSIEDDLRSLQNGDRDYDPDVMQREERQEHAELTPEERERVQELEQRLNEVRTQLQDLSMIEQDEFEDRRDDAAEEIGELAREVREHKYNREWRTPEHAPR